MGGAGPGEGADVTLLARVVGSIVPALLLDEDIVREADEPEL